MSLCCYLLTSAQKADQNRLPIAEQKVSTNALYFAFVNCALLIVSAMDLNAMQSLPENGIKHKLPIFPFFVAKKGISE